MIYALQDSSLDVFTLRGDAEAGIVEITDRIATKRLKVFSSCKDWISQYRSYRRNKDGALIDEGDGLMRAMELLAFPDRNFPLPDAEGDDTAQEDWAAANRDPITGY